MINNKHLNINEIAVLAAVEESIKKKERPLIKNIAKQTFVSAAYIIKLSKKLGFSGYSELVFFMKHQNDSDFFTNTSPTDYVEYAYYDKKMEDICTEILKKKGQPIFFLSMGLADIASEYMIRRLAVLNIYGYIGTPEEHLLKVENAIIIVISSSGENKDLIHLIKNSQYMHNNVYTITKFPNTTLGDLSKDVFTIGDLSKTLLDSSPNFFIAQTIILIEKIIYLLQQRLLAVEK